MIDIALLFTLIIGLVIAVCTAVFLLREAFSNGVSEGEVGVSVLCFFAAGLMIAVPLASMYNLEKERLKVEPAPVQVEEQEVQPTVEEQVEPEDQVQMIPVRDEDKENR